MYSHSKKIYLTVHHLFKYHLNSGFIPYIILYIDLLKSCGEKGLGGLLSQLNEYVLTLNLKGIKEGLHTNSCYDQMIGMMC